MLFQSRARATFFGSLAELAGRGVLTDRPEAGWVAARLAQILAGEGTRRLLLRLNITWLLEVGEQLLGGL